MDPLSSAASVLTVLGAAGGTCKILYGLVIDFKDAPEEIKWQNRKLQRLLENITCLLKICDTLPKELQLAPNFECMQEFVQEINIINVDIEVRKNSLSRGKTARVKEICKWLLHDRHLRRFFDNLEHYNTILSHAISAAQISMLMHISSQLSATDQMRLCSLVHNRDKIAPQINYPLDRIPVIAVEPNNVRSGAIISPYEQRLLARLPRCVETLGLMPHHRWGLGVGAMMLNVRHGPTITRRWSQQREEIFSAEGQGLAVTFDCNHLIRQRFSFIVHIMYHEFSMWRLSSRFNMSLSSLVPSNNSTFKAVEIGDTDHLKRIMTIEPLNICAVTRGGYTLMHSAARYGRHEILSILKDAGADINVTNDRGETPLHISMKQGSNYGCARQLLQLGANPSQPDAEGRTALHMFYNPIVAYMFQYHTDDIDTWAQDNTGKTALHYMAWSSRSSVQELIRCSQKEEMRQLSVKDSQGKSILHYATQRGNTNLIEFLLARPEAATLCMPDYHGRTLLHYATESGRVSTIDLYLARHFDPDAVDSKGRTMLHHACQWGNVKAVEHLVDQGFEYQLDAVDDEKRTPLQLAKHYRSRAVVEYIQQLRPDKEVSDDKDVKITAMIGGSRLAKLKSRSMPNKALFLLLLVSCVLYGFWR